MKINSNSNNNNNNNNNNNILVIKAINPVVSGFLGQNYCYRFVSLIFLMP